MHVFYQLSYYDLYKCGFISATGGEELVYKRMKIKKCLFLVYVINFNLRTNNIIVFKFLYQCIELFEF